jgi:hypothetical protein
MCIMLHIRHAYGTVNVKLLASGCSLSISSKFLGGLWPGNFLRNIRHRCLSGNKDDSLTFLE